MLSKGWALLALIALVGSLILTACEGETVEVTRVVTEKETVVQTVIEKETVVEKETVLETVIVAGTPEVKEVEVTKEVIKEVEVEVVVTAAAPPVVEEGAEAMMGFPRSETAFIAQLSGRVGTPDNFNEWVGWKWRDRGMANLMNEALWTIEYVRGEVIDGLAAGPPEYNEDFTQMTIKLREGVYWSDGVEFTADDVVFTIDTVRTTEGLNYNVQMQDVESVSAPDKYTVVVDLAEPDSRFHAHFLDRWGCLWMMPKHVFEGVEDIIAFEYNPPLSLGPYVLHSYDPAGFWTAWEKREDWDRTPTGMLYGEPAPKYVVFRGGVDPTAQVMGVSRHELDNAVPITIEAQKAGLVMDPYASTFYADFPWSDNFDPCITGLTFNTLKAPFDLREVRWALTLAIDIVSYSATAFDGGTLLSALLTPTLPLHVVHYYGPLQAWLADFELDLGGGETFKPYDPDAALRLAEYVAARGYPVPEDPEGIKATFGLGWWKYAPDVAAKLLEKNGFTRDGDGNWLLPDGTPWKLTILMDQPPGHPAYQNGFAAAHEWGKFGVDVEVSVVDNAAPLTERGEFDVSVDWPAYEPWGGHPDLFRTFNDWNSAYVEPVLGEPHYAHISRWSDPRMDQVITDLKSTDWNDTERIAEIGREGLKLLVEEMPGIATYNYAGPEIKSTYYWTNWPTGDNPYGVSLTHWPNFKYMLPFLEPTGN
jgi:peptide/nickel transport system substrate-binding protein